MRERSAAALFLLGVLLLPQAGAAGAGGAAPARRLRIEVSDSPAAGGGSFQRSADGAYTVSTRSPDGAAAPGRDAAGNGYTLSTGNGTREVMVLEGEAVRVDLPAVQSLQFHVPVTLPGQKSPAAAAASAAPAASGVVTFEAVSAFSARFALVGDQVQVRLVPLRVGGVAAPYAAAGAPAAPLTLTGRVGQWMALGDTDVPRGGKTLVPTADPPAPASVWVRVRPGDQP